MQITHEEARAWVHLNLDGGLNPFQREQLGAHLSACAECRRYADSIGAMESVLRPLLKRHWTQQPIPLPVGSLGLRGSTKNIDSMLLATRIAAMGVMFITFMFSAWHFSLSSSGTSGPAQAFVPSMPIPSTSTHAISIDSGQPECVMMSYIVGKNDTLASIAAQFSVSLDEIIQSNALINNTMVTGQEIIIPVCKSTPTVTIDAQISTLTPVMGRSTSTPGG